jgi:hypothetical protein
VFVAYDGDDGGYVVDFHDGMFCCDASDVEADPRPPVRVERRHNAT